MRKTKNRSAFTATINGRRKKAKLSSYVWPKGGDPLLPHQPKLMDLGHENKKNVQTERRRLSFQLVCQRYSLGIGDLADEQKIKIMQKLPELAKDAKPHRWPRCLILSGPDKTSPYQLTRIITPAYTPDRN